MKRARCNGSPPLCPECVNADAYGEQRPHHASPPVVVHMGPLPEEINRVEFGLLRMYRLRAVATRKLLGG